MSDKRRKISVDARPLARSRSGIRRFLENILAHLPEEKNIDWILYTDLPLRSELKELTDFSTIRIAGESFAAKIFWAWKVRSWLKQDKPDIFWGPRHYLPFGMPSKIRKVVTIHDMVWNNFPETMTFLGRWSEKCFTPLSLNTADVIIAVSDSTARDIAKFQSSLVSKTVVIKHGRTKLPESSGFPTNCESNPLGEYFLAVGTVEPRKNYERLLEAYSAYIRSGGDNKLVIAGTIGWGWKSFNSKMKDLSLGDEVILIENCNDEKLAQLYANAHAFVMVSLAEGYGLPVVEAAEFNLPMLLSDIQVFRELEPRNATWVNPNSIEQITTGLRKVGTATPSTIGSKPLNAEIPEWKAVSKTLVTCLLGTQG